MRPYFQESYMKSGAYAPNRPEPTLYAMSADDIPMFYDMQNLTEKQKADHDENVRLLGHQQVSLMAISKRQDYVGMYDDFKSAPFDKILNRYHALLSKIGLDMVPMDHLIYAPKETYYDDLAKVLPPVEMINLLMVSRSNEALHHNEEEMARNLNLNSKYHFAENSHTFDIPVPDTIITHQPLKGNEEAEAFFEKHNGEVILKMTGFAGGRNVAPVDDIATAEAYLNDYADSAPVILQQRISFDYYQEWTIDLHITDTGISIDNVRRILLADGLWIGNLFHATPPLNSDQEKILINVGEYARSFGFGSSDGNNFGIDFFIGKEGEIVITEINPRWTAGLFPSEILKVLETDVDSVAYYDLISKDKCLEYLDYIESKLPRHSSGKFDVIPLGFMPFDVEVDGNLFVSIWSIVRGDFPAFRAEARELFGDQEFVNADRIPI